LCAVDQLPGFRRRRAAIGPAEEAVHEHVSVRLFHGSAWREQLIMSPMQVLRYEIGRAFVGPRVSDDELVTRLAGA
jgi:hypothetical protein